MNQENNQLESLWTPNDNVEQNSIVIGEDFSMRRPTYCEQTIISQFAKKEEAKTKLKEFMKFDSDKPMMSLVEPQFIVDLAKIVTFGAKKYEKDNWKLCENSDRYKDALLRHIFAYLQGEKIDPESGLPHLSHAACNLMFLHYLDNQHQQQ